MQNIEGILKNLNSSLLNFSITVKKLNKSLTFSSTRGNFLLTDIIPAINLVGDDQLVTCIPSSILEEHLGIEDVNDSIGVGKQLVTCYVFDNLIKDDTRLEAKFITKFYDYERLFRYSYLYSNPLILNQILNYIRYLHSG